MMPTLNVYFWGLICHANRRGDDGSADVAALIDPGDHYPSILFSHNASDQYDLDRESEVRFDHGTESAEFVIKEFEDYVPRLRPILTQGVLRIRKEDAVLFHYPRADSGNPRLLVDDLYPYQGEHRSKYSGQFKRNGPVAKVIRLRVLLEREHVTVRFRSGNKPIARTIPSNSCILVSNIETTLGFQAAADLRIAGRELISAQSADEAETRSISKAGRAIVRAAEIFERFAKQAHVRGPNHFEHYTNLVPGGDTVIAYERDDQPVPPITPSDDCPWVRQYIEDHSQYVRSGTRPECGNTVWP